MLTPPATVQRIASCVLTRVDRPWPFAIENAAAIAQFWRQAQAQNPNFFDGIVHLLSRFDLRDHVLSGDLMPVRFSAFLYWRDNGYPDASVFDCFGSALLRAADGSVILGRQAPGHINDGMTYLPGGFIDERDIAPDGSVDIAASIAREVTEELGYPAEAFVVRPGAYVTRIGQQLSIAVEHVSHLDAQTLVHMARAFLASEADPELADVVVVTRDTDLAGMAMPEFAVALVRHVLDGLKSG